MPGWFFDPVYWSLFWNSFLAATVIPVGSEPLLVLLLTQGYDPVKCLMFAGVGNSLGGMTSYGVGHLGKWEWAEKWLSMKKERIQKWHDRLERFGPFAALLVWLPFVGDLIAVTLGFFRISPLTVFIFMIIGKFGRYAIVIWMVQSAALY